MAASRFTIPRMFLLAALLLAGVAMLRWTGCIGSGPQRQAAPTSPPISEGTLPLLPPSAPIDKPLRTQFALIYYPALETDGLIGEPREIFLTPRPGDRAKQIIAELIRGPETGAALPALPAGTRLRQIYVLDTGVAWVDFSSDLEDGMGGGSASELLTIYSIVDSVALNVSEIRRVGFLIEGKAVESLNGHVDLRRPLKPEVKLIHGDGTVVRDRSTSRMPSTAADPIAASAVRIPAA